MIRREQAEATRETLLDAAAAEFCLHGLGGTRIQDVLDRAGVTKGGLYHHFTSKRDIARELVTHEDAQWPVLIGDVELSGARGLAAIGNLSEAVARHLGRDVRARAALRISEELGEPSATSQFSRWCDFVVRCLQQAIADREVLDSISINEVAGVIVEAVYGVCVCPVPANRHSDAAARVRGLWALMEAGLRVPRP